MLPVAMSTIIFANWAGSRGRLGCFVILPIWQRPSPCQCRLLFKLTHYPHMGGDRSGPMLLKKGS